MIDNNILFKIPDDTIEVNWGYLWYIPIILTFNNKECGMQVYGKKCF